MNEKKLHLYENLNKTCQETLRVALEGAKYRENPLAEPCHWFEQILLTENSDMLLIVRYFSLNENQLFADMTRAIDKLPRRTTSSTRFSDEIFNIIDAGRAYGSMRFESDTIRSGHLILGMMEARGFRDILIDLSSEFLKIDTEKLIAGFPGITKASVENEKAAEAIGVPQAENSDNSALAKYATDLTEKARSGEMDPIVGREDETRHIMNILMRRRQNNPILTGEAGVGKTAVVEGFAQRIAAGDVPPPLKDVSLLMLDIGLLQAGASMKGEFENRLRKVVEEVQASEKPIVLFIDEAHTLIGAGGSEGTGDAANLLKPALARGTLRTIAATTWAEYKKYIEKDPALTRRFQVVKVEEPDEAKAIRMMRGVAKALEAHHQVLLLDEAIEASVQLSHRYVPARQLPDKSISLLDTACARVAVSQYATPPLIEDIERNLRALEVETDILRREAAIGLDRADRLSEIDKERAELEQRDAELQKRWQAERGLIDEIVSLRTELHEQADMPAEEREEKQTSVRQKLDELSVLQGEAPLLHPAVDHQSVASVVEDWTGIPVGRMVKNDVEGILGLSGRLAERVVGQDHAMEMIAKRIQSSRAGLVAPNKPVGVFMLAGPSGVGKTETALALAEALYGGEQNLITINMSEFQEAHTVSTLKGAPPGYVGYGEGGVLTEAVRRRPYSVVLLDEIEKAHSDVHEIFFQVFDKGVMEDGEGRSIDFKNTLILLTSNVGSDLIMELCSEEDPDLKPTPEGIAKALRDPLLKTFPAALLGRLAVIPYFPLSDVMIGTISRMQLNKVAARIKSAHNVELTWGEDVIGLIRERCTELESGGRMIDSIVTNGLLPEISREVLMRVINEEPMHRIDISVADSAFHYAFS